MPEKPKGESSEAEPQKPEKSYIKDWVDLKSSEKLDYVSKALGRVGGEALSAAAHSFLQTKTAADEQIQELKRQLRINRLVLGLSWFIFFTVLMTMSVSGIGAIVVGVFQLVLMLVYMQSNDDAYLKTIYQDIRDILKRNGTDDPESGKDQ